MFKKIIIGLISLMLAIISIAGFLLIDQNIKASLFLDNAEKQADSLRESAKTFYQPEAEIKGVIVAQIKNESESGDLQMAAYSLLKNLNHEADYQNFILIYDPQIDPKQSDLFAPEIQRYYPTASIQTLLITAEMSEAEIFSKLLDMKKENTLFILQTYYQIDTNDLLLNELQQSHLKNAFDNPSKASLDSIPFSNRESIKAFYQLNKDSGSLKTLPTFLDKDHHFFLKEFVNGKGYKTNIATLTFFGDIMLGRFVRTLMDKNTLDYPFENMNQNYLRANDLLLANLEGPVAENKINTTKAIAFRFLPDVIPLLKKYHFDALGVANNHALDMGATGLEDTYRLIEAAGMQPFGNPKTIEKVYKTEINGVQFAFLGLNDIAYKLDREEALKQIDQLAVEGYEVIPFIHWGVEYQHKPLDSDVAFAHQMIDHGASVVIGHHPHVVQSFEIYNGRPIFYSLGNAVFDQYFSQDTKEGLTTTLVFSPESLEIYFLPIKIEQSQVSLMTSEERSAYLQRFVEYWRYDQETKDKILQGKISLQFENNLAIE